MKCSAKLPRRRFLKVRADISRSFRFGTRINGEYLTLIVVPKGIIRVAIDKHEDADGEFQKTAVLVKRSCGKASRRVRLKRLVREFYRLNQQLFPGCEAVIFSLEKAVDDEKKFKEELMELTKRYYDSKILS